VSNGVRGEAESAAASVISISNSKCQQQQQQQQHELAERQQSLTTRIESMIVDKQSGTWSRDIFNDPLRTNQLSNFR